MSTLLYFEDLELGAVFEAGPCAISAELLDHALELTGEHHPVHADSSFAASTQMGDRVIPGTFVHLFLEGQLNAKHGTPARAGAARMHVDYLSPLHPGALCRITARVTAKAAVSDQVGSVQWVRTVYGASGEVMAVARVTEPVRRRGARSGHPS